MVDLKSWTLVVENSKNWFKDLNIRIAGGWSMVAEVPADEPLKVKCEGLENKKQYKFRVTASNKLGASEPAMLRETVLAKDPWGEDFFR